jgi:hypothetical protein
VLACFTWNLRKTRKTSATKLVIQLRFEPLYNPAPGTSLRVKLTWVFRKNSEMVQSFVSIFTLDYVKHATLSRQAAADKEPIKRMPVRNKISRDCVIKLQERLVVTPFVSLLEQFGSTSVKTLPAVAVCRERVTTVVRPFSHNHKTVKTML